MVWEPESDVFKDATKGGVLAKEVGVRKSVLCFALGRKYLEDSWRPAFPLQAQKFGFEKRVSPAPTLVNSAFPELPREVLFPRNLSLLVPLLRHSEAAVVMEHHTCLAPAHTGIRAHGAGSV